MTRRLRIEWSPGEKVTGRLAIPASVAGPGVLLANGAGAGQDSPFMTFVRDSLSRRGYPVMTFDYPYQEAGRRSPDRRERLDACHRAAAERLRGYVDDVVWAGKSMGGRLASHLVAAGQAAAGLIVLGYPLVPLGRGEPRSTEHFAAIDVPVLLVQGTRDRMAPLELLQDRLGALRRGEIAIIEDGDHSLKLPKRSGLTVEEGWASVVALVVAWLEALDQS